MDVLCVGMYRACSTWQFNIACQLVERHYVGRRLGYVRGLHYRPQSGPWRVLKSHDHDAAFGEALAQQQALALYSFRDLRDVAFSLVHKYRSSFEERHEQRLMLYACVQADRFWTSQPGVLVQRYENMVSDPGRAIRQIASHLGITPGDGEIDMLVQEHSLEANRRRTSELAETLQQQGVDLQQLENACLADGQTLWHWNHFRSGANGQWHDTITPRQLLLLAAVCTDWLVERGYETDPRWWQRVAEQRRWRPEEIEAAALESIRDRQAQQWQQQEQLDALQRRLTEQGDALAQQGEALALCKQRLEQCLRQLRAAEEDRARTQVNYHHSQAALQQTQGLLAEVSEKWRGLEQHGQTALATATRVARVIGRLRSLVRRWRPSG